MEPAMRLLNTTQTLDQLNISRTMLHKLVMSGKMPVVKIGRSNLFDVRDIERFITDCKGMVASA